MGSRDLEKRGAEIEGQRSGDREGQKEREVSQEHVWKKEPRLLGALEKSPGFWKKRV